MCRLVTVFSMISAFLLLASLKAGAQPAQSFEQLQMLVKLGDNVSVTDATGVVTEGQIAGLSSSALRLRVNSMIRDLSESDVNTISQRRPDSLKNGTLIGAGIGLGVGAGILAGFCGGDYDCEGNPGEVAGYLALYSGIGAAIGAGVDALIKTKQTIYLGTNRVTLNLHDVRPIISPSRKGASISLSF